MTCKVIRDENGHVAIVCTRSSMELCGCGCKATLLCDFPLKGKKVGQTCDRPLCPKCAVKYPMPESKHAVKGRVDLCPVHARRLQHVPVF